MSTCQDRNQSLDPLQTIMDESNSKVYTLENQAREILPFVSSFRSIGESFPIGSISSAYVVNNALNEMTAEAICASSTDLAPINDLVQDCLNDALAGVRKYINNILYNIEDGIDAIQDILNLPENGLFKLFQKIWGLCQDIKDLISGIDGKLECVSLSEQGSAYVDQIQDLEDRIGTVTDDLHLADDGGFDPDKLVEGFETDLQDNIQLFNTKSKDLQKEIVTDISNTVDLSATVNPKRFF